MSEGVERLVYMANQIAGNFATRGPERAAAATAEHLRRYWDPGMKAKIFQRLDAGEAGLTATAAAAIRLVRKGGEEAER
ncbi:MAG TPA: formate dehydrogenase subunit delta [Caulobacteraceae bacterium]|jgi:formate dehydrogenase subunit delta|nr:formate dehydrogenase subunit delta [Caulobacteraceae bacterium]